MYVTSLKGIATILSIFSDESTSDGVLAISKSEAKKGDIASYA